MTEYTPAPINKANFNYADPKAKWSEDYFRQHIEGLEELGNVDIRSKKGLEKLVSVANDARILELKPESREKWFKGFQQYAQSQLAENTLNNADKVSEALVPQIVPEYVKQTPSFELKGDKEYNEIISHKSKYEEIAKAKKSPEGRKKYHQELFNNCDAHTVMNWAKYADEIMQGELAREEREMISGIQKYGVGKFISKNLKGARDLAEEVEKAEGELSEKIQKKMEEKTVSLKRDLTPYEVAEINDSFEKAREDFHKKYATHLDAAEKLPKMIGTLQSFAYQSILAREEAEKEELAKAA